MAKRAATIDPMEMEQLASIFRMLGDQTRVRLIWTLARGEQSVNNLCEELDLAQPTVSHHLGLLRMNNLIGYRRSGKQVFYNLNARISMIDPKRLSVAIDNYAIELLQTGK